MAFVFLCTNMEHVYHFNIRSSCCQAMMSSLQKDLMFHQVHITLYYNYIPKKMWGLQSIKYRENATDISEAKSVQSVFCVTYHPYLSLLKPNVDFVKELFCAKKTVSLGLKQAGETPANPILTKTSKLQDGWSLRVCLARPSGYTCVNHTND